MARSAAQMKPIQLAELDKDAPYDGLTSRQHLYVTLSFSGLSNIEAYRQAYDCEGMAPGTLAERAHLIAHNPLVRAKLKELVASREERSSVSAWLTKDWIINGIAGLAQVADKDSTRLAAYIALGKTAGIDLFRETVRHEQVTRTVEDVEQELKQKLDTLRAGLTIEGKAERLEPGASPPASTKDRRRKPASK